MVVLASRSASGEGELAEREMLEIFEERAVKGRFRGWDCVCDCVCVSDRGLGFEREVGRPDCDARAVLVVLRWMDFGWPLVVRSGGILIEVVKGDGLTRLIRGPYCHRILRKPDQFFTTMVGL
jgi:hypothetical protein